MISAGTAAGELPRLFELDPLRFQGLCRDLYQTEPGVSNVEVFGLSGQVQRGVDIIAYPKEGDGIDVGQCKRVQPASFTVSLIREASREFKKHLDYWRRRGVRRFILFVSADASNTQIQNEHLRQRTAFRKVGIHYELWSAAQLTNKLRSRSGIVGSYLGSYWVDQLCGSGVTGFPHELSIANGLLRVQLETLAGHVSAEAEVEVERIRTEWRKGRRTKVAKRLSKLRSSSRWQALSPEVKAKIVRFEGQLALDSGDLHGAIILASSADELDPGSGLRLRALIARAEGRLDEAEQSLRLATDIEGTTLRAALLMEQGSVHDAMSVLAPIAGSAEVCRLRSLGFAFLGDMISARLESEKAFQLEPKWHAVIQTRSLVNYLSVLSPIVLRRGIPEWPEPIDPVFVKTDDTSRHLLMVASDGFEQIEQHVELKPEELRIIEAWHLGCLANNPDRREIANDYARSVLGHDPANYRILIWVIARKLDVDPSGAVALLKERCRTQTASVSEVITLLAWYARNSEFESAEGLLSTFRDLFVGSNATELWNFWSAQVHGAAKTPFPESASDADEPLGNEAKLMRIRARSQASGNWEPLIGALNERVEAGDSQSSFELCRLYSFLGRWDQAANLAESIPTQVGTADALGLACTVLYNARRFEKCLYLLDANRSLLPQAKLPAYLQKLRVAAQRELGLLPAAAAEAEDLFSADASKEHFIMLADLYFEKGDLPSLVQLATQHKQFELSIIELLRLAIRVSDDNKLVAIELWRRAVAERVDDLEVMPALDVGFRLGLDNELRSLILRLGGLSKAKNGHVVSMTVAQTRDFILARHQDLERVYEIYRKSQAPIHLVAERFNQPLSLWYHREMSNNEQSGGPGAVPVFARQGWRVGHSVKVPGPKIRIHADLTSLLLAEHLGILGRIEEAFEPIYLPHRAAIALIEMRDATKPKQPVRQEWLRTVSELVGSGEVRLVEPIPDDGSVPLQSGIDMRTASILRRAERDNWLAGLYLPILNGDGVPADVPSQFSSLLRSPHSVVKALYVAGEISIQNRDGALDLLGADQDARPAPTIEKGVTILCGAEVLTSLASAAILAEAARVFHLCITRSDFTGLIAQELRAFQRAGDDGEWLTRLIARVTQGIDSGRYKLLPDFTSAPGPAQPDSPTAKCFLDLFVFTPVPDDCIWIDDRFVTGFVQRDGAPIIDTVDVLYMMHSRGLISRGELYGLYHRIREGGVRFLAISQEEIGHLVDDANSSAVGLSESRELRTLRRYYARCLADAPILNLHPAHPGMPLSEWPFLLASGGAIIDSVADLWRRSDNSSHRHAKAEWILRNLYVPDRGRSFSLVEHSADDDRRAEAIALAAYLTNGLGFLALASKQVRQARRDYLHWVYYRLIRQRFDADPLLQTATADIFKALLLQSIGSVSDDEKKRSLAGATVGLLLEDMPQELKELIVADAEFLQRTGVSGRPVVRFEECEVDPKTFWLAAETAFQSRVLVECKTQQRILTVRVAADARRLSLQVDDVSARKTFILLGDGAGILSLDIFEREAAVRGISKGFDLPEQETEAAIANLASQSDLQTRMEELQRLRTDSAALRYTDLQSRIMQRAGIEMSELLPANVRSLLRHLRLNAETGCGNLPLKQALELSGKVLISELGIIEAVVRLSGLPVALPSGVISELESLERSKRRSVLKSLIAQIGRSPLGVIHLSRLFMRFSSDSPSYRRFARAALKKFAASEDGTRAKAWLAILRFYSNEMPFSAEFQQASIEHRLCAVWLHSDRIFRTLANAGVDEVWISDHFKRSENRLPEEIVFADRAYSADIAHPRRVTWTGLLLAGIAYALQGSALDSSLQEEISQYLAADIRRMMELMRDTSLGTDATTSFLRFEGAAAWLSVLNTEDSENLSPRALRSLVSQALDRVADGDQQQIAVAHAVIFDQQVPDELAPSLQRAILSLDLVSLKATNPQAAPLAAVFAAQHAGRIGEEIVAHVRSQLVLLAAAWAGDLDENSPKNSIFLLSAAYYLYADLEEKERFPAVVKLIEEMVDKWPKSAEGFLEAVDRLAEGLSNSESRLFWPLQVKLRAIR